MATGYRSDDGVLHEIARELSLEHRRGAARLYPTARSILSARAARTTAGVVGALGGTAVLGTAAAIGINNTSWLLERRDTHGYLTMGLLGTWAAMLAFYGVARFLPRLSLQRVARRAGRIRGDARAAVARLRREDPRADILALVARSEASSVGWPLAALALLAPLTIHFVFWGSGILGGSFHAAADFDAWIKLSAVMVGLGHAMLALSALTFGYRLARERRPISGAREGFKALGAAVVASCLPGILAFGIPPAVVAFTGVLFVPLAFHAAGARIASERERLASC